MANKILFLPILLSSSMYAITIQDWNGITEGIMQDMEGRFSYNNTQANTYVLKSGIFFSNPFAKLKIRFDISGTWTDCGMIFCAKKQNNESANIVFNKGNLEFFINSSMIQSSTVGFFALYDESSLDISANLSITTTRASQITEGIFTLQNANLRIENANLYIDTHPLQNKPNNIIKAKQTSKIIINAGGEKNDKSIILNGGISLEDASYLELKLTNPQSYLSGDINLSGTSQFNLNLNNSQATFTSYTQNNGSNAQITLQNQSALNAMIEKTKGNGTTITLSSQSVWNIQGNSEINQLSLQNGIANLLSDRFNTPFNEQRTLTASNLSGNGIFKLYADVANKQVDTTSFTKANGYHTMQIFYNPQTFQQILAQSITQADDMIVATINQNDSNAIFEGGITEMGLVNYKTNLIKRNRTNKTGVEWVIDSIQQYGDSPLSKALSTALNTPYRLFDLSSSTLSLRLGDLRNYPKDYGLYFRYIIGLNQLKETSNTLKSKETWMSFNGGYDLNKLYKNRVDFLGFGFDVTLMDSKNSIYQSQTQAYGANLYYTSIFHNRFYYDVILKYAFSPTLIEIQNLKTLTDSLKFNSHLITLGFETGKKFAFNKSKNFFYLEPQGKITSGIILPTSIITHDIYNEKITGNLKAQIPLLTKASLYMGYEWNEDFVGDLKFGAFIDFSLFNGGKIVLKDPRNELTKKFDSDFDVGISAMGSIALQKSFRFYFQFDSAFLGNYSANVAFNAGVRWSFGDRYVPPPPPPADPNRLKLHFKHKNTRRTIPVVQEDEIYQMKHYEGNRQRIIDSYHPSTQPRTPQNPSSKESWNTNRFYPRDTHMPNKGYNTQEETQKERLGNPFVR